MFGKGRDFSCHSWGLAVAPPLSPQRKLSGPTGWKWFRSELCASVCSHSLFLYNWMQTYSLCCVVMTTVHRAHSRTLSWSVSNVNILRESVVGGVKDDVWLAWNTTVTGSGDGLRWCSPRRRCPRCLRPRGFMLSARRTSVIIKFCQVLSQFLFSLFVAGLEKKQ